MTSIIDNIISGIENPDFTKRLGAREQPPLGKYLQWLVESEQVAVFKEGTPEEKVAHQLHVVPLAVPNDPTSKRSKFGQNINLFYPNPVAAGQKESTNIFPWEQVADASALDLGDDPMPSRAVYNAASRSYTIDGEPVTKGHGKERNDGTRRNFTTKVIQASLAQVAAGIDAQGEAFAAEHNISLDGMSRDQRKLTLAEAGFKPDLSKIELTLFAGHLFYATAVQNGEYVNVDSSAKKGGKPFVRELPDGEEYGFSTDG